MRCPRDVRYHRERDLTTSRQVTNVPFCTRAGHQAKIPQPQFISEFPKFPLPPDANQ
jgi:hypothetical protein